MFTKLAEDSQIEKPLQSWRYLYKAFLKEFMFHESRKHIQAEDFRVYQQQEWKKKDNG